MVLTAASLSTTRVIPTEKKGELRKDVGSVEGGRTTREVVTLLLPFSRTKEGRLRRL